MSVAAVTLASLVAALVFGAVVATRWFEAGHTKYGFIEIPS